MRRVLVTAFIMAALSAPAAAQDAKSVLASASKAMGADTLKTVEYSGSGFDFAIGQAPNPNLPWPKFIDKTYTRQINFETPASKMDRIRMQGENPPHGGGQQPVIGEQPQNQTIIVAANTPWVQQLEIWMMPQGFLRAAAARNATAASQSVGGKKMTVVTFMGENKAKVNGYINDQNLVEKVETWIDNAVLGDMLFEAVYSDYKDFGGVKFPTKIVQRQGGHPILDLTINDVKPNAAVTIQPPQGRGGAPGGAPPAAAAAGTPTEKLAEGVYLILGGYASVAVDFKDGIVVIEGPQSDQRAEQIITEAKRLIPNKPIKYVVNTHHHWDHLGGIRTYVHEGATVITHEANRPYYQEVLRARPWVLEPDRFSLNPPEEWSEGYIFETVREKFILGDDTRTIELHSVAGLAHALGMLVVYIPKEKIVVQADLYNPQATALNASNRTFYQNLQRLKLDVATIVGIHGNPGPMAPFVQLMSKAQ